MDANQILVIVGSALFFVGFIALGIISHKKRNELSPEKEKEILERLAKAETTQTPSDIVTPDTPDRDENIWVEK